MVYDDWLKSVCRRGIKCHDFGEYRRFIHKAIPKGKVPLVSGPSCSMLEGLRVMHGIPPREKYDQQVIEGFFEGLERCSKMISSGEYRFGAGTLNLGIDSIDDLYSIYPGDDFGSNGGNSLDNVFYRLGPPIGSRSHRNKIFETGFILLHGDAPSEDKWEQHGLILWLGEKNPSKGRGNVSRDFYFEAESCSEFFPSPSLEDCVGAKYMWELKRGDRSRAGDVSSLFKGVRGEYEAKNWCLLPKDSSKN